MQSIFSKEDKERIRTQLLAEGREMMLERGIIYNFFSFQERFYPRDHPFLLGWKTRCTISGLKNTKY